jgi:chorismate synthase
MSGNSFGIIFRVTTWGESHGKALGAVIDGCPPGIDLSEADIQRELERRAPGRNPRSSARKEGDRVEILSGIFAGKTTGTPVSLAVFNRDHDPAAYDDLRDVFRPGHGDFTYFRKYGIRDHRGGGRASGRETVARVAAGAVAKKILAAEGINVLAYTAELGGVAIGSFDPEAAENSVLRCPDPEAARRMEAKLDEAARRGDTLGGVAGIVVRGCPAGLGEPVFDKMDADLAKALMSIGTVKGVEIGAGFRAVEMTGSACNDPIGPDGFRSNNAGGILAGITTGGEIVIRAACKPIPSIAAVQDTIDTSGNAVKLSVRGRHDVSVFPRIIPVCEAMVAIVIADHLLRQRAVKEEAERLRG